MESDNRRNKKLLGVADLARIQAHGDQLIQMAQNNDEKGIRSVIEALGAMFPADARESELQAQIRPEIVQDAFFQAVTAKPAGLRAAPGFIKAVRGVL